MKAFDRIKMAVWRVLLPLLVQLHEPSGHAAMNATFFDHQNASKHYCRRTNSRVQTLKTTALVDTETQTVLAFAVRPRNVTTPSSVGNSSATTRASCSASLPTRDTVSS